jgi:hypothetical protein
MARAFLTLLQHWSGAITSSRSKMNSGQVGCWSNSRGGLFGTDRNESGVPIPAAPRESNRIFALWLSSRPPLTTAFQIRFIDISEWATPDNGDYGTQPRFKGQRSVINGKLFEPGDGPMKAGPARTRHARGTRTACAPETIRTSDLCLRLTQALFILTCFCAPREQFADQR